MAKQVSVVCDVAPLLCFPWKVGREINEIVGYWAEDGSEYWVTCPHQLRDALIVMQNRLACLYEQLETARRAQEKANKALALLLGHKAD